MKNIFIHLGFIFILVGCSIIFIDKASASINNYYDDVNKSNEIIINVHNNYNDFKESSLVIKDNIIDVSKSFNFYLDDFQIKNVDILEKVKKVEKDINSLSTVVNNLIDYCVYDLNDEIMDNECSSFKINFKNMLDSYSKMVDVYNDVIKKYNDYSLLNGRELVDEYSENIDEEVEVAIAKIN